MGKKFEDVTKEKILNLHSLGFSNRKIGKELNIHWSSIGYFLKKKGIISNGRKMEPIDRIGDNDAKCSKCGVIKHITDFQKGRKDKQYEYHFSFCNECRKKQAYANLNSTIEKFLSNSFNRLKKRAEKENVVCSISKNRFLEVYYTQKGRCFYTNEIMEWGVGKGHSRLALSVDKVIPEKGYTDGNVVFCTVRANTMKNDLSIKDIKKYLPLFYKKILKYGN